MPLASDAPRPAAAADADTRTRILRTALRLFRQHGYHGVGINQILADAAAPKGSMYHHFPGGKEEIGAAVVTLINQGVLAIVQAQPAELSAAGVVQRVGDALLDALQRTRHELCSLFAAFAAERSSSPRLAAAVAGAYAELVSLLEARLVQDGWPQDEAREKALLVVALFEGGSLLSAAQQDMLAYRLALRQAVALCAAPSPR